MAAQQEALRRQMQEYGQELQKEGTGVDKSYQRNDAADGTDGNGPGK